MKTLSEIYEQNYKVAASLEALQSAMQAMADHEIAVISTSIVDNKPNLVVDYSDNLELLAVTIGDLDRCSLVVCGCVVSWTECKELAA
jgi:hypothetical protein